MSSIFDIILIPLGFIIRILYMLIPNYAIALFLFALVIKAILFPLFIKQQKNSINMARLRPKETVIRKKYAGRTDKATQMKMNQEVQALYQSEKYNPLSGCLPLLIQLPILFGLMYVIRSPLTYISQLSSTVITALQTKALSLNLPQFATYTDPTKIDQLHLINAMTTNGAQFSSILPAHAVIPSFSLFGINLSQTPSISQISGLVIIPVLAAVATYLSMKLSRRWMFQPNVAGGDQSGSAVKMSNVLMDVTAPLMTLWAAFSFAAAIGLYWIFQSILAVVQQYLLSRMYPIPKITEADIKEAERQYNSKNKAERKPKPVRKRESYGELHLDDDELDSSASEDEDEDILSDDEPIDTDAIDKDDGLRQFDKSDGYEGGDSTEDDEKADQDATPRQGALPKGLNRADKYDKYVNSRNKKYQGKRKK